MNSCTRKKEKEVLDSYTRKRRSFIWLCDKSKRFWRI